MPFYLLCFQKFFPFPPSPLFLRVYGGVKLSYFSAVWEGPMYVCLDRLLRGKKFKFNCVTSINVPYKIWKNNNERSLIIIVVSIDLLFSNYSLQKWIFHCRRINKMYRVLENIKRLTFTVRFTHAFMYLHIAIARYRKCTLPRVSKIYLKFKNNFQKYSNFEIPKSPFWKYLKSTTKSASKMLKIMSPKIISGKVMVLDPIL